MRKNRSNFREISSYCMRASRNEKNVKLLLSCRYGAFLHQPQTNETSIKFHVLATSIEQTTYFPFKLSHDTSPLVKKIELNSLYGFYTFNIGLLMMRITMSQGIQCWCLQFHRTQTWRTVYLATCFCQTFTSFNGPCKVISPNSSNW